MACAHAKFTGETGICLATSGPGAVHLLNGLYDAKMDHVPVVAIVGQAATSALGGSYQREVDLQVLLQDVTEYVYTVSNAAAMRHVVDRAVRTAKGMRAVTCVIVPKDVQETPAVPAPPHAHNNMNSSVGYCAPVVIPAQLDLQRAADIQRRKARCLNGRARRRQCDGRGPGCCRSLGGGHRESAARKYVVRDDLPYVTGTLGLLGTLPSYEMMNDCDTLLLVGTCYPYSEFFAKAGPGSGGADRHRSAQRGLAFPTEVNLIGDSRDTLAALLPLLKPKADSAWREKIEKGQKGWHADEEARCHVKGDLINPQLVFWELNERLPDNAILNGDAGTPTNWFARNMSSGSQKMRDSLRALQRNIRRSGL
jgi:pyruvate dehydrogenase (quinone)